MTSPSVCPVAPTFFAIFLFREAVAKTKQRELVAVARAEIVKIENFMVVAVGYLVVLLIIIDLREYLKIIYIIIV